MSPGHRSPALMGLALSALGGDEFLAHDQSRICVSAHVDDPVACRARGWRALEDLLATATFETNVFRLMADRGRVEPDLYLHTTLSGGILKRALRTEVLMHELAGGATLTINGADRLHRGLEADREVLEYAVAQPAWCNGFLSHTAVSAFGRHHDDHAVVVVQAEGHKHWKVYEPVPSEQESRTVFDAVLKPGDVLHVPAGWDHEVTGTGAPSLHWTFGFVVPSHADLVLGELTHQVRQGAPVDTLRAPDSSTLDPSALRRAMRLRSMERRTGSSLPWALGVTLPALEHIRVRWAARLPPVIDGTGGAMSVGSLGKRFRVDSRLAEAMRTLARGDSVPGADLVAGAATEAVVRTFLDWAVCQRLILVEAVE